MSEMMLIAYLFLALFVIVGFAFVLVMGDDRE